jgi:class 3 adenylate cyclase
LHDADTVFTDTAFIDQANSSSDSKDGLYKFWLIALTSYFTSLFFACFLWFWFFHHKLPPGDDSSDEEDAPYDSTAASDFDDQLNQGALQADTGEEIAIPRSWKEGTQEERLKIAALSSLIISCTMGVYAFLRFFHRPACAPFKPYVHIPEMMLLASIVALTGWCWHTPRNYLYWPALILLMLYIPAVALPPFNLSCATLMQECQDDEHWRISQAVRHVDCSLQGQTPQQIILTMFLLLPWLLPEKKYMYLIIIWVFNVYVIWSVAYFRYSEDLSATFDALDVVTRCLLLGGTWIFAMLKKQYVEKSQQNKYLSDLAQREDTFKFYNILKFMLPEHVILRILMGKGEPIAETVDEASILFVVIDDFDSIVRRKSPELLLRFLNKYFTKFDTICRHYGVQKIETVGEEYVCCVGVTPADIDESRENGHTHNLRRLLKAASQILHLQSEDVKFKMGIHTGPIVAGVVAQKLPRYRLFGDTINTAARMMQKGEVGSLQFGEATQRLLPSDMRSEPRGEIEMKGKGRVQTYLFRTPPRATTVVSDSAQFDADDEGAEAEWGEHRGLLKELMKPHRGWDEEPYHQRDRKQKQPFGHFRKNVKRKTRFKDVIAEITSEQNRQAAGILSGAMNTRSHRWILSEKEGFTPKMEQEFRMSFHRDQTCKKLERRLDLQILCLLLLSVLEYLWNIPSPHHPDLGWSEAHDIFPTWARRPLFIVSRLTALLLLMGLRYAATVSSWVKTNPDFQFYLVVSSCLVALAMFLSYDVMITASPGTYTDERAGRVAAPFDQIFSLVFVLIFFFICSGHKVLFFQSLIFIPLSLLLVCFTSVRAHSGIYFPVIGQVLFVVIAISFSVLAHSEEQTLRARYKATNATKTTKERVEAILRTMMPPMVLEQVQEATDPNTSVTHQYECATIVQSDLCGFTKIASGLKPTEVVKFITEIFGLFDDLTNEFGVYKIETVGDAYIGGQAEHPLTEKNSPSSVILFGIAMISQVINWSKRRDMDVRCRVGVHHGSCIGGIVDKEMQRYHIFGQMMQAIEVLESTATEGSVQISPACRDAVLAERKRNSEVEKPELHFKQREEDHLVTSKGEVHSYEEIGGRTFLIQGPALQYRAASGAVGFARSSTGTSL